MRAIRISDHGDEESAISRAIIETVTIEADGRNGRRSSGRLQREPALRKRFSRKAPRPSRVPRRRRPTLARIFFLPATSVFFWRSHGRVFDQPTGLNARR
jgi:hypothetical protein